MFFLRSNKVNFAYSSFNLCFYLCLNRFGVLILEQKLDFAFPIVRRAFQLGELVSPQNSLKCEEKKKEEQIKNRSLNLYSTKIQRRHLYLQQYDFANSCATIFFYFYE